MGQPGEKAAKAAKAAIAVLKLQFFHCHYYRPLLTSSLLDLLVHLLRGQNLQHFPANNIIYFTKHARMNYVSSYSPALLKTRCICR